MCPTGGDYECTYFRSWTVRGILPNVDAITAVLHIPALHHSSHSSTLYTLGYCTDIIFVAKWGTSGMGSRNRRLLYECGRKHLFHSDPSTICS